MRPLRLTQWLSVVRAWPEWAAQHEDDVNLLVRPGGMP
jgi:hypothetical protein